MAILEKIHTNEAGGSPEGKVKNPLAAANALETSSYKTRPDGAARMFTYAEKTHVRKGDPSVTPHAGERFWIFEAESPEKGPFQAPPERFLVFESGGIEKIS